MAAARNIHLAFSVEVRIRHLIRRQIIEIIHKY